MITWAILPVKPFDKGKSRLRAIFSADDLLNFNKFLFQETFIKLSMCSFIDKIMVVSRDHEALDWTTANSGIALLENESVNMNEGIQSGLDWIKNHNTGKVLVLPVDLPLMTNTDLVKLFSYIPADQGSLIVPDRKYIGTNALFLSKPDLSEPAFGEDSFQKHCDAIAERGLRLVIYHNQNIQHDIDTPEDLNDIPEEAQFWRHLSR